MVVMVIMVMVFTMFKASISFSSCWIGSLMIGDCDIDLGESEYLVLQLLYRID